VLVLPGPRGFFRDLCLFCSLRIFWGFLTQIPEWRSESIFMILLIFAECRFRCAGELAPVAPGAASRYSKRHCCVAPSLCASAHDHSNAPPRWSYCDCQVVERRPQPVVIGDVGGNEVFSARLSGRSAV